MSFTATKKKKKNFETTCTSIKQVMNMYAFRGFQVESIVESSEQVFGGISFSHISPTHV